MLENNLNKKQLNFGMQLFRKCQGIIIYYCGVKTDTMEKAHMNMEQR